jgi:outer membrane protein assembly factor BamA
VILLAVASVLVGVQVEGPSKTTERTVAQLAHVDIGQPISDADLPQIETYLTSSQLFQSVDVRLEQDGTVPDGVILYATLDDKHSWVIAPTLYLLGAAKAAGVGFGENNFRGENQKFLLYGQLGEITSQFFAAFLDPAWRGGKWTWRVDAFSYRRNNNEYENPHDDETDADLAAIHGTSYLGAGALLGYRFKWWLVGDVRLRGGYVWYRGSYEPEDEDDNDPETQGPRVPVPNQDGRDVSLQTHLVFDRRQSENGVTWGPYAQLTLDKSIPGLDQYGYFISNLRAQYAWKLFGEHQLELRTYLGWGYHLPFHEDFTLGSATDLRGYAYEQFRGDTRVLGRVEYSVPVAKYKFIRLRAIGFFDSGYIGFHQLRDPGERIYQPSQLNDNGWFRNDVGAGIRIYVGAIVLPLVGVDVAYGIEGKEPQLYLQIGLTDF